jgi:hypothetical protein
VKRGTSVALGLAWGLPVGFLIVVALAAFDTVTLGGAAWLLGAAFGWVVSGDGIPAGNRFGGFVALLTAAISLFVRLARWSQAISEKLAGWRLENAKREADKL